MPIRPPALDDRSFSDLVAELVARIPAHTPEWTNPRPGDPGRTMIELFAWLADTMLYRANLIPERQRLAFLHLLGVQMRPATPATGLVTVSIGDEKATQPEYLQALATVGRAVPFETRSELTVLPLTGEAYYKRGLTKAERQQLEPVVSGLKSIYKLSGQPTPYVTTPVFAGGAPQPAGFDLMKAVDKCLWIALLAAKAPKPEEQDALNAKIKAALEATPQGARQLLNLGFVPTNEVTTLPEDVTPRGRVPHVWEISGVDTRGDPLYRALTYVADTTEGLTQRGVLRLVLPGQDIAAPSNDVRTDVRAGVGDRPPRLDTQDKARRLIAWLRLRPTETLTTFSLSWAGINAVEIDQRQTVRGRVIGESDGSAGQEYQLPGRPVEPESFVLQVEETDRGYQPWQMVDDLGLAGRNDAVFSLDPEAGTVRFGDGVRGRVPEQGRRIRVAIARIGGGKAGNLPGGSLAEISARSIEGGRPVTTKLLVGQTMPAQGGEDGETLAEAEQRIPALLRHRDRAVTGEDYQRLALDAPGARVGRVEVLSRFKPQQRRPNVPGVVSVMVLPQADGYEAPYPRPDRPFVETIYNYLDARRPLGTELYVIGCQYIPIGISVAVSIQDGFLSDGSTASMGAIGGVLGGVGGQSTVASRTRARQVAERDTVLNAVEDALRRFMWPLVAGGAGGQGWELGRTVRDRELAAHVARVAGVASVNEVNLFTRSGDRWQVVARSAPDGPALMRLEAWQLPELLSVVVTVGQQAPDNLAGAPNPFAALQAVAVPVVPEVC